MYSKKLKNNFQNNTMNPIQTVKKLKKVVSETNKCAYPNCPNDKFIDVKLPIGQLTESNLINFPDQNRRGNVGLCMYHRVMSQKGILNLVNQKGLIRLWGPYNLIDIIEAVTEAREFTKINGPKNEETK